MGLLDDMLGGMLGNAAGRSTSTPAPAPAGGGMSPVLTALLPIVLNMLMNRQGGGSTGGAGGLGNILGGMFGGAGAGGLGGLLEQFQRAGFAEQASSWVGGGANQAITPEAIGQVFGGDAVARIAQQAGITETEASHGLSQLLPEVVDRLTPGGGVPDLDQLSASVDDLARRFGG